MSTEALRSSEMEISLDARLAQICLQLSFNSPPSIKWDPTMNSRFVGMYVVKRHEISISSQIPQETIDHIIIHELCHALMHRVGYKSAGHSWIFLATFELLCRRCGAGENFVEGCAVANWNRTTPWPIWYRHVVAAQGVVSELAERSEWLQQASAEIIAATVVEKASYGRYLAWFFWRWHEIVADLRGNWFAVWLASKGLCFLSLGFFAMPYAGFQRAGLWTFGLGVAGLFVISKVFRLDGNR